MHVADVSKGILGANGIVGGIAIAAGAAMGIWWRARKGCGLSCSAMARQIRAC
jgi:TPP-dependent pyruvate/acetoin dehydrogenase alpha subunit